MEREALFQVDEQAEKKDLEKYANFTFLFDIWMRDMEDGKQAASFFWERGYKTAAVYGMGLIGKHLLRQLEHTGVEVLYTIEQGRISYRGGSYELEQIKTAAPQPDVIVVTPLLEYESIRDSLEKLTDCAIVSAEEVILSI